MNFLIIGLNKEKMEKIERLNEFLEKEGVLKEFYDNLKFDGKWIDNDPKNLIVWDSFDWVASPEGGNFWAKINAKWKEELL